MTVPNQVPAEKRLHSFCKIRYYVPMTLKDLALGKTGRILKVGGNGELRQHFLDMGIIPGTAVTKVKLAPMGDPAEFDVSGYELTMRLDDAQKIEVGECEGSGVESGTGNGPLPLDRKSRILAGIDQHKRCH